jgi:hypothetical protein
VTLETAVLLGQAGYGRITLSRPDRIGPDALLALGGLTPDGRPRPERASPEFARAKPLELYLGERGDLLRQPTRETLMAISLLRRAGVKVPLSRAAERALRALR